MFERSSVSLKNRNTTHGLFFMSLFAFHDIRSAMPKYIIALKRHVYTRSLLWENKIIACYSVSYTPQLNCVSELCPFLGNVHIYLS